VSSFEPTELRRLPWSAENGGDAFVTAGDGIINDVADAAEAAMLEVAESDAKRATELADDPYVSRAELTLAVRYLTRAIEDAVKVAQLRGERLPPPGDTERTMGALLRASLRLP
jgi:hypothetical protein